MKNARGEARRAELAPLESREEHVKWERFELEFWRNLGWFYLSRGSSRSRRTFGVMTRSSSRPRDELANEVHVGYNSSGLSSGASRGRDAPDF